MNALKRLLFGLRIPIQVRGRKVAVPVVFASLIACCGLASIGSALNGGQRQAAIVPIGETRAVRSPVPTFTARPSTTPVPTRTPPATATPAPTATSEPTATAEPTATSVPATATIEPAAPEPTAAPKPQAMQELLSLTSPIGRNSNATLAVRTVPGARCTIAVYYSSRASQAEGLEPRTAGDDGACAWTWMVGQNTRPGTWRIVVTTGNAKHEYPFVVE